MKLSSLDRDDLVGRHANFTYEKRRGRESNPRIDSLSRIYPVDAARIGE
jgi:hypothetical protein